jgi:hypothetical protein
MLTHRGLSINALFEHAPFFLMVGKSALAKMLKVVQQ